MFCGKCGAAIEEECKFCVCCGAKIEDDLIVSDENLHSDMTVEELPIEQEQVTDDIDQPETTPEEPRRKKKMSKLVKGLIIVASILAVLAGVFFTFKDYIVFTFLRMMPADVQYSYVYNRAASELSQKISDRTDTLNDVLFKDETTRGSVTVDIDEGISTLLKNVGVNMGNVDKVSFDYTVIKDGDLCKVVYSLGNGNISIINIEVCADSKEQKITLEIPELNSEVLEMDLSDYYKSIDELYDKPIFAQPTEEFYNALMPSEELVEKLMLKYLKVALTEIKDIERSSETLSANGVNQDSIKFVATIDSETLVDMVVAILDEARSDDDIKEYIFNVVKAYKNSDVFGDLDIEPKDVWEVYREYIDGIVQNLENSEVSFDTEIVYTTYVNFKGDIIGIELSVEKDEKDVCCFKLAKTKDGKARGFICEYEMGKMTIARIEGKGNVNRDKFTGQADVFISGYELLSLDFTDFNFKSLEEGYPQGTVEIELDGIVSLLLDKSPLLGAVNTNACLTFEFDCSKRNTDVKITVDAMNMKFGTISWTQEKSKVESISFPSDTEDDLYKWLQKTDTNKLIENLKKTGLLEVLQKSGLKAR